MSLENLLTFPLFDSLILDWIQTIKFLFQYQYQYQYIYELGWGGGLGVCVFLFIFNIR